MKLRYYILIFFLLIVVGGVGLYMYVARLADQRLKDVIARVDQLDPGWRLEELEAKRVKLPDNENSAVRVMAATKLKATDAISNDDESRHFTDVPSHKQLNARQIELLRVYRKIMEPALTEVKPIADMPKGRYVVVWSDDAISTLLPHIQEAREVARMLSMESMLQAQDKDLAGAAQTWRALFNTGRSIGDEGTCISLLVRIAIEAVSIKNLERLLAQGELSAEALKAVQSLLEDEAAQPLFLIAMRGERAFSDRAVLALGNGKLSPAALGAAGGVGSGNSTLSKLIGYFLMGSLTNQRSSMLEHTSDVVEIAKLPEMEQKPKLDQLMATVPTKPMMVRLLAPAIDKVHGAFQRGQAGLRSAICAVAAERYRLKHGQWPESLAQLVPEYLKQIPNDPYVGNPILLRRAEDGLILYSVGADKQDNQGNLGGNPMAPGTDYGFRLWDVKSRRQAPEPIKKDEPKEPEGNPGGP